MAACFGLLALFGCGGAKASCGFGEQVDFAFGRDCNVSGENDAESKAGQLLVRRLGERRCQNLLCRPLVAPVIVGEVLGYVVGEGIRVKIDEGAEKYPQLYRGERRRRVLKDALEDGFAGFQNFGFAVALRLDLGLLLVKLPLALLLAALAFFLVLRPLPLERGLTLPRLPPPSRLLLRVP